MTTDDAVQSIKCPSCGAPLDIEPGQATIKCSYCEETVVIPESLRIPARPTFQYAPPPVTTSPPGFQVQGTTPQKRPFIVGRFFSVFIICILLGGAASFAFGFNLLGSFQFANKVMTFGSEGIGQGLFQDPRALGVDGNGNIVVSDFKDGRIQTFTPDGKFISTFTVKTSSGKPANPLSIAVSHDGKIYVPNEAIYVYDESGKQLGTIGGDIQHIYMNVALGTDGRLYALTFGDDNLVRFKTDGSIDLEIPNAVESVTGQSGGFPSLAVDGLGNIYIAVSSPPVILKYSPDGKYIDQFGGEAKDAGQFEPGKFVSPMGIAIDGYGRIFVNDFYDLQVFDSSGKYLKDISGGYYGVAFDSQNNLYTTPVTKHDVAKFQIQKPAQ